MPENLEAAAQGQSDQQSRELPTQYRRAAYQAARWCICARPRSRTSTVWTRIEAYVGASGITGKDRGCRACRGARVGASFRGLDARARRRLNPVWAILRLAAPSHGRLSPKADHDGDGEIDAAESDNVIGMIFLIDIDGWARSARIQVVLGQDYRGRGYSRDIMPRVMTYGSRP